MKKEIQKCSKTIDFRNQRKSKIKSLKNQNGITLISLIVTIIVLLILAGISVSTLTQNNGIITNAQHAKTQTEISSEKEIVEIAVTSTIGKTKNNGMKLDILQDELNSLTGEGKTEASETGDAFDVVFKETNRLYTVDKDGNVSQEGEIKNDSNPGVINKKQDGSDLSGDSEESAYEIYSIEDLVQLSKMTNDGNTFEGKYIKIAKDLNFNSDYSYSDKDNTELFGDYNEDGTTEGIKAELTKSGAKGFVPLSTFSGILLGNGKKIENISIQCELSSDERRSGLIKENMGTVKDLKLAGKININVKVGANYVYRVGGVCGDNTGRISNVQNEINISGNCESGTAWFNFGGITGLCRGTSDEDRKTIIIENCTNSGTISATGVADCRIGGISGGLKYASVQKCKNSGYVKADTSDYACPGGISSEAEKSEINECYNEGKIEAIGKSRVYTGGITSMDYCDTIKNSYNKGENIINGYAARSGGLVGACEDGTVIENCYNIGTLRATENSTVIRIGGLVGIVFDRDNHASITVKNSYNAGIMDIKGSATEKGTLYGIFFGTFENCYARPIEGIELAGSTSDKVTMLNCATKT